MRKKSFQSKPAVIQRYRHFFVSLKTAGGMKYAEIRQFRINNCAIYGAKALGYVTDTNGIYHWALNDVTTEVLQQIINETSRFTNEGNKRAKARRKYENSDIQNTDIQLVKTPELFNNLSGYQDKDLVIELRSRGYEIIARKTIEL